jgi:hypothetical protein
MCPVSRRDHPSSASGQSRLTYGSSATYTVQAVIESNAMLAASLKSNPTSPSRSNE